MPKSSEKSTTCGGYRALCCDAEIFLEAGVFFPDCPKHQGVPTEWELISEANLGTLKPKHNRRQKLFETATSGQSAGVGRTDPPRFRIGSLVRVLNTISSRYSSRVGKVVALKSSRHSRTLDKYDVVFSDDSASTFWDIQLEVAREENAEPL